MEESNKRIDNLISRLKEIDSDMANIIVLGCDVKQLDGALKKFI